MPPSTQRRPSMVTGGYTPGTAQLAATACTSGTPEPRSNVRNSPVSASTAVMTRARAGHCVLTSREPITSSRSCSDGVTPAFSAASASAPIRRRNSTSLPRLRTIAQPNWARVARFSRAALPAVAGSSCRWYIASSSAPQASCAPTTDPADVPTTRSAPLRSVPASASPASTPISHAMPVMPPPPSTRAVRWSLMRRILTDTRTCLDSACELSHAESHTAGARSPTKWMRMTATQASTPTAASWPPGLPRSLEYPSVPVGSILRAAVRRWGDRTAFIDHDLPLTFTALGPRAHAVAGWLADHGVGRGDVVAVHIPNCRQYPPLYYGILLAGATFSPTNPRLPAPDLAAQLTDAGATVLITWDQVLPFVRGALAATPVRTVVVTGEAHTLDLAARLDGLEDDDVDAAELFAADPTDRHLDADLDPAADLAHLAYTGGTTGVSKGVELPHRNVVTNVLQSACWTSGSRPVLDEEGDVTARQVLGEDECPTRLGEAKIINLTPWFHAMGAIGYLNGM